MYIHESEALPWVTGAFFLDGFVAQRAELITVYQEGMPDCYDVKFT